VKIADILKKRTVEIDTTTSTTADMPLPTVGVSGQKDFDLDDKVTVSDLAELIDDLRSVFSETSEEGEEEDTYALMFLDVVERVVRFKNIEDAVLNQMYFDLASLLDIADDEKLDAEENEIEEIDLDEAVAVPKRINPRVHNARKMAYKKNKARIKIMAARFRKTASFKKYQRRKKQMSKVGKTATGKRHARFV